MDQLVVLGMGDLPPLIGNPYNGYINPYYWVDDHPALYGNNGSLDPSTFSKWLITMVIVSPLAGVVGPLPNGRTSWLINWGLLTTY